VKNINFLHPYLIEVLKTKRKTFGWGERRRGTLCFVLIKDFHKKINKFKKEIPRIFNEILEIIDKYEGVLDKFTGDIILFSFGAIRAHEDDNIRGALCTQEIVNFLVNKGFDSRGSVHEGEFLAITVGNEKRTEFTLMGDTVNTCSRMLKLADKGEVVVEKKLIQKIPFKFEFKGVFKVKGKKKPLEIYIFKKEKKIKKETEKLYGRDKEREILERFLKKGKGIILIYGDKGTGKTALIKNVLKDYPYKYINFYSFERETPFILLHKIGIKGKIKNVWEGLEKLKKIKGIFWIDKLENLDSFSLEILKYIKRIYINSLFILESRKKFDFSSINLKNFTKEETHIVIKEFTGYSPDSFLLEKIYKRTKGNPYLLIHSLNYLKENKGLKRIKNKVFLDKEKIFDEMPHDIDYFYQGKIDRLPYKEVEKLKRCSMFLYPFSRTDYKILWREEPNFDFLIKENFLTKIGNNHFYFSDEEIMNILYSRILLKERKEYHKKIAEIWEKRKRRVEYKGIIGKHYFRAENFEKSAEFLKEYMDFLFKSGFFYEIEKYIKEYEICLSKRKKPDNDLIHLLYFYKTLIYQSEGKFKEAFEILKKEEKWALRAGKEIHIKCMIDQIDFLIRQGMLDEAFKKARILERYKLDIDKKAELYNSLLNLLNKKRDFETIEFYKKKFEEISDLLPENKPTKGFFYGNLAVYHTNKGEFDKALNILYKLKEFAVKNKFDYLLLNYYNQKARVLTLLNKNPEPYFRKALKLARKLYLKEEEMRALFNYAVWLQDNKRDYKKAIEIYNEVFPIIKMLNDKWSTFLYYHNMGEIYLYTGDLKKSVFYYKQAIINGRDFKGFLPYAYHGALLSLLLRDFSVLNQMNEFEEKEFWRKIFVYDLKSAENIFRKKIKENEWYRCILNLIMGNDVVPPDRFNFPFYPFIYEFFYRLKFRKPGKFGNLFEQNVFLEHILTEKYTKEIFRKFPVPEILFEYIRKKLKKNKKIPLKRFSKYIEKIFINMDKKEKVIFLLNFKEFFLEFYAKNYEFIENRRLYKKEVDEVIKIYITTNSEIILGDLKKIDKRVYEFFRSL